MMYFDPGLLFIGFVFMGIGYYVQNKLKSKFHKYSQVSLRKNLSGREIAEIMLRDHDIYDVKVVSVPGKLTDHYDPTHKRLALSEENYKGTNLAALGVAAHEAGHAIQHDVGYKALKFRMALIPITNISSQLLPFVIIGGLFFGILGLIKLGIMVYLVLTVFQLVTLPVAFDASKRAKAQLPNLCIIYQKTQ